MRCDRDKCSQDAGNTSWVADDWFCASINSENSHSLRLPSCPNSHAVLDGVCTVLQDGDSRCLRKDSDFDQGAKSAKRWADWVLQSTCPRLFSIKRLC